MNIFRVFPVLFIAIFSMTATVHALPVTNVSLGKTVTLEGGDFFTGGWSGSWTTTADTVVDGIFFPRGQRWDRGPVWWDDRDGIANHVVIDLSGTFTIESFIIQADDNDAYLLEYWDIANSAWQTAWDVPTRYNWGMQTRPNVNDDLARYVLGSTITTDTLRFSGNLSRGDRYFSVSEIQAFGYAASVPEPAMLVLLGAGFLGFMGRPQGATKTTCLSSPTAA